MANSLVKVVASGSYIIGIDGDDDSTAERFVVNKHDSTTPVELLVVDETGNMSLKVGKGDFSAGGFRTKVISGSPSGGEDGDIVLRTDVSTKRLYVRLDGNWYHFGQATIMCW